MQFYPHDTNKESDVDLELRPPLPIDHGPLVSQQYTLLVHKHLCRMYIASEILHLGTEARFASLVLFHRYTCHYFGSGLNNNTDDDGGDDGDHNNDDNDVDCMSKTKGSNQKSKSSSSNSTVPLNKKSGINEISSVNTDKEQLPQKKEHQHLGKVAAACLFLGTKITEQSKRLRDIINISHKLDFMCQHPSANLYPLTNPWKTTSMLVSSNARSTSTSSSSQKNKRLKTSISEVEYPPELDQSYWETKEQIIVMEQSVLRMLHFDFIVPIPHKVLLLIAQRLGIQKSVHSPQCIQKQKSKTALFWDPYKNNPSIIQHAWSILNQTVFHANILRYDVMTLACAALHLSLLIIQQRQKSQLNNSSSSNASRHQIDSDTNGKGNKNDNLWVYSLNNEHVNIHTHDDKHWWISFGVDNMSFFDAVQSLNDQCL